MLRIGDFARLTRVSVRMLRHYDRLRLLAPAHIDPGTGYRYYRPAQLPRLNRILLLRELGFGLPEIARVLDGDEAAYERREHDLLAELALTTARLAALRARRAQVEGTDVVLRPVPPQRMATVSAGRDEDVSELFDELEPTGPLREVYLRFGAEPDLALPRTHVADEADPGYVTELQVPVRARIG